MSFAQVFAAQPLALYPLAVGGVDCTALTVALALDCLEAARGLMIRQPLARIRNPLAECDYHTVAAPYRSRFEISDPTGRGAAGRHIAKQAFCQALTDLLSQASHLDPVTAFGTVAHRAWLAFSSDFVYAEQMAKAARLLGPRPPLVAVPALAVA